VLRRIGAAGAAGFAAAVAGCSGGGDGGEADGQDGGDGSGESSGGEDGGSGSADGSGGEQGTTAGEGGGGMSTLRLGIAPGPTIKVELSYLREETNILEEVMSEAGYEPDITLSFDELPLFLGKKVDFAPSIGTVEAAQLGVEQDQQLTAHAVVAPQHTGLYVREGGDYDPDVAGGKQAAVDRLVEDNAKFGIGGFGLGTIPAYQLIFDQKYGYEFGREGDFNIVTADFPTLSRLVAKGDIAAGGSAPPYGLWGVRDQVKPVFWNQEELPDIGFGRLTIAIGNGITRTAFAQNNAEGLAAWYGALKRGREHIRNNISDFASRSSVQEALRVPSQEAAAWVMNFRYNAEHSPNRFPASLTDVTFTEERIQRDREALSAAQEFDAVPSGWEEKLSYQTHDIQKYYEIAKNTE